MNRCSSTPGVSAVKSSYKNGWVLVTYHLPPTNKRRPARRRILPLERVWGGVRHALPGWGAGSRVPRLREPFVYHLVARRVGWFVACFSKSHAAQQRHWFGQLTISHIKQQVVYPCSHTIKHGSKVKTKRLSFVASFSIHFEPRFGPLGWLCALYSSATGRKNRSRGLYAAIPMTKIRAPSCRLKWRCAPRK
jgi:hypothetical protein